MRINVVLESKEHREFRKLLKDMPNRSTLVNWFSSKGEKVYLHTLKDLKDDRSMTKLTIFTNNYELTDIYFVT